VAVEERTDEERRTNSLVVSSGYSGQRARAGSWDRGRAHGSIWAGTQAVVIPGG